MNVSATHSIIGGIIGFAIAHKGSIGVIWVLDKPESFPPYAGVVPIVISWFFSPVFTAIGAFIIFVTTRTLVLRSSDAVRRSYFVLPLLVMVTIWINIFFVFTKGAKTQLQKNAEEWTFEKSMWIAAVVAAGCGLLSLLTIPFIMKRVEERMIAMKAEADEEQAAADGKSIEKAPLVAPNPYSWEGFKARVAASSFFVTLTPEQKAELEAQNEVDEFDPTKAEKFNVEAEIVFSYLQIVTAIAVIFAHGSNEVGYATGPLATIWDVVQGSQKIAYSSSTPIVITPATATDKAFTTYTVKDDPNILPKFPSLAKTITPPYWIIYLCAAGLVSGLFFYGQKLTLATAYKMAKLSPSRGYSAELATAIVITIAAQYGLPTSSSQCLTGGIVGVGCAEGISGVNWRYFAKTFWAWVLTMFIMGIVTGLCYAQGAFAPLELNP